MRCLRSSSGCKILVSSISMVLLKPKVNFFCILVHNFLRGMTPEDAELQYLDNARKLPLYGVDLHTAVVCTVLILIPLATHKLKNIMSSSCHNRNQHHKTYGGHPTILLCVYESTPLFLT